MWGRVAALVMVMVAPIRVEAAQAPEHAKQRFEQGVSFFEDGDFESAAFEFQAAFDDSGNAHLLYNIAVCHAELHQYSLSLAAYERYLAALSRELSEERVREVKREIRKLRLRVGRVRFESTPAGANVRVADELLGQTPLELMLDVGSFEVEISLDGHEAEVRSFRVVGGEPTTFEVQLRPQKGSSRVPELGRVPEPEVRADTLDEGRKSHRLKVAAISSASVAGVAGVGAIVFGTLAMGTNRDIADAKREVVTRAELDQLGTQRDGRAIGTDVLIAVTCVAAALSVGFGVAHLRTQKRSDMRRARVSPGSLTVRF